MGLRIVVRKSITGYINKLRLEAWRTAVSTRAGAARWMRSRLSRASDLDGGKATDLQSAHFSPNEIASSLVSSLASRWNVGWRRISRADQPFTGNMDQYDMPLREFDGALDREAPQALEEVPVNTDKFPRSKGNPL